MALIVIMSCAFLLRLALSRRALEKDHTKPPTSTHCGEQPNKLQALRRKTQRARRDISTRQAASNGHPAIRQSRLLEDAEDTQLATQLATHIISNARTLDFPAPSVPQQPRSDQAAQASTAANVGADHELLDLLRIPAIYDMVFGEEVSTDDSSSAPGMAGRCPNAQMSAAADCDYLETYDVGDVTPIDRNYAIVAQSIAIIWPSEREEERATAQARSWMAWLFGQTASRF
ncbi:hypothetical protein DAEQUDRAFT_761564 [Daedalea quercina L-15889]|uniref:Uncharacterized protein n=1 Tax=Daedalea quercina L-15889 TaxID=1314783 RepID=A0A165TY27_9APHY|nr:hypothetical protein DAEQUDRAFT_761564 [Daedalea quercina L-15889]